MPVAGVQRGNAEGMQSTASRWESSGALPWERGRRDLLPHGVTAYPLEFALEEQTISLPWSTFFFPSPLRKCLFLSLYIYHVHS